jgi:hypothetical protein
MNCRPVYLNRGNDDCPAVEGRCDIWLDRQAWHLHKWFLVRGKPIRIADRDVLADHCHGRAQMQSHTPDAHWTPQRGGGVSRDQWSCPKGQRDKGGAQKRDHDQA